MCTVRSDGTMGPRSASLLLLTSFLAHAHEEVSEAYKEIRSGDLEARLGPDGKPEGLPVEIADAIMVLLQMAYGLGIDIEDMMRLKMAYNRRRPHRHGKVL